MKFPARRAVAGDKFLRPKINKRFESHLFHPFVVAESWWIIEERVGSMRLDLSASLSLVGCFYYLLEMAACSLVGAELRRRAAFCWDFSRLVILKPAAFFMGHARWNYMGIFKCSLAQTFYTATHRGSNAAGVTPRECLRAYIGRALPCKSQLLFAQFIRREAFEFVLRTRWQNFITKSDLIFALCNNRHINPFAIITREHKIF